MAGHTTIDLMQSPRLLPEGALDFPLPLPHLGRAPMVVHLIIRQQGELIVSVFRFPLNCRFCDRRGPRRRTACWRDAEHFFAEAEAKFS
jgi:hypothetical protein